MNAIDQKADIFKDIMKIDDLNILDKIKSFVTSFIKNNDTDSDKYFSPAVIAELDKRMEEYKKDPSSAMDMEQFIKELENEDESI